METLTPYRVDRPHCMPQDTRLDVHEYLLYIQYTHTLSLCMVALYPGGSRVVASSSRPLGYSCWHLIADRGSENLHTNTRYTKQERARLGHTNINIHTYVYGHMYTYTCMSVCAFCVYVWYVWLPCAWATESSWSSCCALWAFSDIWASSAALCTHHITHMTHIRMRYATNISYRAKY